MVPRKWFDQSVARRGNALSSVCSVTCLEPVNFCSYCKDCLTWAYDLFRLDSVPVNFCSYCEDCLTWASDLFRLDSVPQ